jgi:hypothetical protein
MAKTNSWHVNLLYIWHAILINVAKLRAKWQHCVSRDSHSKYQFQNLT